MPALIATVLVSTLTGCASSSSSPASTPASTATPDTTTGASTTTTIDPTSGKINFEEFFTGVVIALADGVNTKAAPNPATAADLEAAIREYAAVDPGNVVLPPPDEAATTGCATIAYVGDPESITWHIAIRDGAAVAAAGSCTF